MIDKEMLEAIGQMMAEQSKQMADVMDAKLAEALEPIREDLQAVKADVAQLPEMNRRIGLLMDAQVETRDKVKRLDKVADDVEEIKVKVAALESVTKENTSQIKDIRLAK